MSGQRAAVDAAAPIGVFDSGVGGLTVARAIMDQLPHESILYAVSYTHLRAHETGRNLVCRLLLSLIHI